MIARVEKAVSALQGWRRYLLAFATGAFMVAAMPPAGVFPALFISIPVLMWLVASARGALGAFMTGWAFGCGFFIVGLYWLGIAFKAFFSHVMWLFPVSVIGIPVYIALYYAAAALLAWPFRRNRTHYALMFTVMLFWAEYLRGHYITNFPWNHLGYGWHHVLPVLQASAWFGIYGLTLLTIVWAAAPVMSRRGGAAVLLSLFFVAGFGLCHLRLNPTVETPHLVRIVQPNISQAEKEGGGKKEDIFLRHLTLSATETAHDDKIRFVVWPETAVDMFSPEDRRNIDRITLSLPQNAYGLIGVNRMVPAPVPGVRNSLIVLHPRSQRLIAQHDKFILAPWGEYIPYAELLRKTPFGQYVGAIPPMIAGSGPSTIRLGPDQLPAFSPIICFESTFAGRMKDITRGKPDFLLFITNDAWSMGTPGPAQHFGFARVRAIEEGLPIVRAANSGISGIIDAQGRILHRLDLGQAGIIDAPVPEPAAKPTLYAGTGDSLILLLAGCLTLCLLLLSYFFRPHRRVKS
jgi:apolipoprotein N-acyltransferase